MQELIKPNRRSTRGHGVSHRGPGELRGNLRRRHVAMPWGLANGGELSYDSDMTDDNTESDPQRPRKRWRKTRWFYGIVLSYFAITIAAGVWWSAYSHEKFNEAVDSIIASGQPLAWSDFAIEPVPDDQNAAILYTRAIEVPIVQDNSKVIRLVFAEFMEQRELEAHNVIHEFFKDREVRRKHAKELRKLMGMARQAFALCREARSLDKINWGIDFTRNAYELDLFGIQDHIRVAVLLSLAAVEAHDAGRDDDAVEYLRDILALGRALDTAPTAVHHLMSIAIHAHIDPALEQILPSIQVGDSPGRVKRENLRAFMSELLDTTQCSRGLTRALMGERSTGYDISQSILILKILDEQSSGVPGVKTYSVVSSSNPLLRSSFDFGVAPLFRLDAAWAIKHNDAYVRTSKLGTLPECRRSLRAPLKELDERVENLSFSQPLTTLLVPRLERMFELHHAAIARRRLSAAAIAVRMYKIDHGSRPESLEDLVPKYLLKVPQDPMDEPGKSIRYINDPETPRLYSVGQNGLDEQGVFDDLGEVDTKEILMFLIQRPRTDKKDSESDSDGGD